MNIFLASTKSSIYRVNRRHLFTAFSASVSVIFLMAGLFADQALFHWQEWGITPLSLSSLPCFLTAPLLHTSISHLLVNSVTMLVLGTLAGTIYPRAILLALPLLWLGSGLAAWLLGNPGSLHYGADGITYGLFFLVATLSLLRIDRLAIAISLIAGSFYTIMMMTVLPQTPQISWPSHLGGAVAGTISGLLLQLLNPGALNNTSSVNQHGSESQNG